MAKPISVEQIKQILNDLDEDAYLVVDDKKNIEVMLGSTIIGIIYMRPAGYKPSDIASSTLEVQSALHKINLTFRS